VHIQQVLRFTVGCMLVGFPSLIFYITGILRRRIEAGCKGDRKRKKNSALATVVQPAFVRSFQQRDYLWPILQKEPELNKNLKPNEGW
jgi:hypothetical protein